MVDMVFIADSADRTHWFRGIGPYRLATELRNLNISCQVLDFSGFYNEETFKKLIDLYVNQDTKFIGISCSWIALPHLLSGRYYDIMSGNGKQKIDTIEDIYKNSFSYAVTHNEELRFINYIKSKSPNIKILMGGTRSISFIEKSWIDHIFLGFSESQLIDYVLNYDKKEYPKIINWDIKSSKNWDFTCSGYVKYTESDHILPNETLPLEVGRGCVFKCKFCSFPLLGKKKGSYMKDPELLYNELLENYNQWGVTNYVISDETFNDSVDKLRELRNIIKRLPFETNFWAYCRMELAGAFPEQFELLQDIGLREMQYGIETLNDETAKIIGKGLPAERKKEILKTAKKIWKDRIRIKANFIVGLPKETKESIEETARWILSDDCPIDFASMFPYILYKENQYSHLGWSSVFEKEYNKWGYFFKENEDPLYWYKNDGTDIDSFLTATKLSKSLMTEIEKKNRPTEMFYYSNDRWYKKTLEDFLKLDYPTLFSLPEFQNKKEELFKQIQQKYVEKHLKK